MRRMLLATATAAALLLPALASAHQERCDPKEADRGQAKAGSKGAVGGAGQAGASAAPMPACDPGTCEPGEGQAEPGYVVGGSCAWNDQVGWSAHDALIYRNYGGLGSADFDDSGYCGNYVSGGGAGVGAGTGGG